MADNLFRPKVRAGKLGERKKQDGQFRNIPSYPEFGGFSGASKIKDQRNPSMALERSPTAHKGKPI
jgi:hypothetical protein